MALKKKYDDSDEEIPIFDGALIYKRGEHWQMRMWLNKERKYARFSLKTTNRAAAEDRAKQHYHTLMAQQLSGQAYFAITTKAGVDMYLEYKKTLVGVEGGIVAGRYATIRTHLTHWLDFIGRDTKLSELTLTSGYSYFQKRSKTKKSLQISQTTVLNEQSTINAMMLWLYKRKHTDLTSIEFDKLQRVDRGDFSLRRSSFSAEEVAAIEIATVTYCDKKIQELSDDEWQQRRLACYYFLIASVTGMRTGEQRQLTWNDIVWDETYDEEKNKIVYLVNVTVRRETSKVRKTRSFYVPDKGYFEKLADFLLKMRRSKVGMYDETFTSLGPYPIFSLDGKSVISTRAILYHFDKLLDLAKIKNREQRDLVPYSFRHYFITQRILNGVSHRKVADQCGTSIAQIEKTYWHLDDQIKIREAVEGYKGDNYDALQDYDDDDE
jgi:integrase